MSVFDNIKNHIDGGKRFVPEPVPVRIPFEKVKIKSPSLKLKTLVYWRKCKKHRECRTTTQSTCPWCSTPVSDEKTQICMKCQCSFRKGRKVYHFCIRINKSLAEKAFFRIKEKD